MPSVRNALFVVVGATALNIILLGNASIKSVEYMDSNQFCGLTCHTVMAPEYTAFLNSAHSRVGCAPCRNANKSDLRVWGEHHPSIIEAVRRLEGAVTAERASRGHAGDATFFVLDRGGPAPIDRVLEWARTDRGGRQLPLLREDPDSGCFRWGICEPPTRDDDE